MIRVELKLAYHWHCENCGDVNFTLPQKAELTDDEAEMCYRQEHELDAWSELPANWRDFEMVQIPSVVTCSECGSKFETEDEQPA